MKSFVDSNPPVDSNDTIKFYKVLYKVTLLKFYIKFYVKFYVKFYILRTTGYYYSDHIKIIISY